MRNILLTLCLLSGLAFAQTDVNILTIIPHTDAMGAPDAVGQIIGQDLTATPKTYTLLAPDTITTTYNVKMPTGPGATGCLVGTLTTITQQLSFDATCAGIGSLIWTRTGSNIAPTNATDTVSIANTLTIKANSTNNLLTLQNSSAATIGSIDSAANAQLITAEFGSQSNIAGGTYSAVGSGGFSVRTAAAGGNPTVSISTSIVRTLLADGSAVVNSLDLNGATTPQVNLTTGTGLTCAGGFRYSSSNVQYSNDCSTWANLTTISGYWSPYVYGTANIGNTNAGQVAVSGLAIYPNSHMPWNTVLGTMLGAYSKSATPTGDVGCYMVFSDDAPVPPELEGYLQANMCMMTNADPDYRRLKFEIKETGIWHNITFQEQGSGGFVGIYNTPKPGAILEIGTDTADTSAVEMIRLNGQLLGSGWERYINFMGYGGGGDYSVGQLRATLNGTAREMQLIVAGIATLRARENGYVGIGDVNPTAPLEIKTPSASTSITTGLQIEGQTLGNGFGRTIDITGNSGTVVGRMTAYLTGADRQMWLEPGSNKTLIAYLSGDVEIDRQLGVNITAAYPLHVQSEIGAASTSYATIAQLEGSAVSNGWERGLVFSGNSGTEFGKISTYVTAAERHLKLWAGGTLGLTVRETGSVYVVTDLFATSETLTGSLTVSSYGQFGGNVNSTGGAIQTNTVTRISNSGAFTGTTGVFSGAITVASCTGCDSYWTRAVGNIFPTTSTDKIQLLADMIIGTDVGAAIGTAAKRAGAVEALSFTVRRGASATANCILSGQSATSGVVFNACYDTSGNPTFYADSTYFVKVYSSLRWAEDTGLAVSSASEGLIYASSASHTFKASLNGGSYYDLVTTQGGQSIAGTTTLATLVMSGGISGGTTVFGSGNFNSTGGNIQTNSVTRISNAGAFTGTTGNFSGAITVASCTGCDSYWTRAVGNIFPTTSTDKIQLLADMIIGTDVGAAIGTAAKRAGAVEALSFTVRRGASATANCILSGQSATSGVVFNACYDTSGNPTFYADSTYFVKVYSSLRWAEDTGLAVSSASEGLIYASSASHTFKASLNGGSYYDLVTTQGGQSIAGTTTLATLTMTGAISGGTSIIGSGVFNTTAGSFQINGVDAITSGRNGALVAMTLTSTLSGGTISSFGLGAVGTPSYSFTGDLNTGMWSSAADTLNFSTGGVEALRITSSQTVGVNVTPTGPFQAMGASGFDIMINQVSGGYVTLNAINNNNTANVPLEFRASKIVLTAGNFGVGVDPGSHGVSVSGDILATSDYNTSAGAYKINGTTVVDGTHIGFPSSAWTSYTPSTTNLSSVTVTSAAWEQVGKTSFVRFNVTGTSNASTPTFSLPSTVISTETMVCTITTGGATIPAGVVMATTTATVTTYNNSALANGVAYQFVCNAVYENN